MNEVQYDYNRVGKQVTDKKGKVSKIRKYHMEPEEIGETSARWLKDIDSIPSSIRKLAHSTFFNPYRKGIYYAQLQALYLLGSNQWHELSVLIPKIQEVMENIQIIKREKGDVCSTNAWKIFKEKLPSSYSNINKSIVGKIQENFIFMQRLTGLHPSGYKLRQVFAALDYKRVSCSNMSSGMWYYRLSTYDNMEQAIPTRDFSEFDAPKNHKKYVTSKFIGKIITIK
jgi:hypothetical protein